MRKRKGISDQTENKRVQILVPPELKARLDNIFRWGEWNSTAISFLEWLCDMHDKMGNQIFLIFRQGQFSELVKRQIEEAQNDDIQKN